MGQPPITSSSQPVSPQQPVPPVQTTPPSSKKLLYVISILLVIVSVGVGAFFLGQRTASNKVAPTPTQVACTEEAKICPDGSSVGRVGPNCEFAPCPVDETANWKTYTSTKEG